MKRNSVSKMMNRISRRDSLPLLRGMFVYPEQLKRNRSSSRTEEEQIPAEQPVTSGAFERVNKLMQKSSCFSCTEEDGLYLTAGEGLYLG